MKKLLIFFAVVGLLGASTAMAGSADIVFIVDESGSMGGEHAWISGMATSLDAALVDAGVTDNRYALVGFGEWAGTSHDPEPRDYPHKHTVGSGDFGTAANLVSATSGLVTTGGYEDGYLAIDYVMDNYTFRTGAAVNFILITDEPRISSYGNILDSSLTLSSMTTALTGAGILLNSVINSYHYDDSNNRLLGISGTDAGAAGDGYSADGSGDFTVTPGPGNTATGLSAPGYANLAWETGGASWDLNLLRAGGLTADSFTAAFVDIKVEEIVNTVVPLPGAAWMGLVLLGGLGAARLRRRR